jgi:hypothetical protein
MYVQARTYDPQTTKGCEKFHFYNTCHLRDYRSPNTSSNVYIHAADTTALLYNIYLYLRIMLYRFFFSKICTASSYNVFITIIIIIIIIRIITITIIIIVGTKTCERHRSSVNKMTRETGPVKFSTAPSPNLVRNAHCSCT